MSLKIMERRLNPLKKLLLTVFFCGYSLISFANESIWLQDLDCKLIGPNDFSILSKNGVLISYVCVSHDSVITCSTTSKNDTMSGGKPSTLTTFKQVVLDKQIAVWEATSHHGMIILDLEKKRYSVSQTIIIGEGLVNKNCVGEIRSYSLGHQP